jgi:leader peptidase (prepilin peptidase)/N-methyltransferase
MDAYALFLSMPHQPFDAALFALLGLMIGSFINVVIYRLPVMMQAQWEDECAGLQGTTTEEKPRFNLMVPRSRCPVCQHHLSWYENIPVASYVMQAGQCRHCQAAISIRYPIIEIASAALFAFCAWRWGVSGTALLWSGFSGALLTLAMIDWDTTLLPDDITMPLLWVGLIAAVSGLTPVSTSDAVWGAVAGYGSLWGIYWAFKLVTHKEGMGFGDFKLFAALGAWFGWQALIPIILMASVIGALVGIVMKFSSGLREGAYLPFGPFLAGAGLTAMVVGPQAMMQTIGL